MQRFSLLFIVFIVYLLLDYYVFQAIKLLTADLQSNYRYGISILYWSFTLFTFLSGIVFIASDPSKYATVRTFIATAFFMNLLGKLTAGTFLFAEDIMRLGKHLYSGLFMSGGEGSSGGVDLSRSEFLSKSALIAGSIPVSMMSFGIISGAYDYRVRRRTVLMKNLPSAFDGIRIAQLSDIHSGSFYNKTAVKGGVDLMNAEKPDLFLFTGDLVNNEAKEVQEYKDIFAKIKAPEGKFSVLGNHDYGDYKSWNSPQEKSRNLEVLKKAHADMGWNLLLNEHEYLQVGNDRLGIIGVENWGARGFAKYGNLDEAMQNVEADAQILLSHDPSHWDAEIRRKYPSIDLTLAGHTHGFQFGVEIGNFRWSPAQYLYEQWADLYTKGNQHLYVNRGFGFLGYPGRVGILPEITILELKKG